METITMWLLAWLLLVVQGFVPLIHSAEQYVIAVLYPAEEYIQEAPHTVGQVAQDFPVSSSVSSTSITSTAVATKTVAKKIVEEIKNIPVVALKDTTVTYTQVPASLTPEETLASTNAQRYRGGLTLLENNPTLTTIALKKAQDMITYDYFAHESPSGKTIGDLAKDAGYGYLTVGENLAFGDFKNGAALVDAWMNSPGHRANIMNTSYTEIGIAVVRGVIGGQEGWVAVQEFGLPENVCPVPDTKTYATLEELHIQINALDTELTQKKKKIESTSRKDPLYDTLVSEYNESITSRNDLAALYTLAAKRYNTLVEEFNTCVSEKLNK